VADRRPRVLGHATARDRHREQVKKLVGELADDLAEELRIERSRVVECIQGVMADDPEELPHSAVSIARRVDLTPGQVKVCACAVLARAHGLGRKELEDATLAAEYVRSLLPPRGSNFRKRHPTMAFDIPRACGGRLMASEKGTLPRARRLLRAGERKLAAAATALRKVEKDPGARVLANQLPERDRRAGLPKLLDAVAADLAAAAAPLPIDRRRSTRANLGWAGEAVRIAKSVWEDSGRRASVSKRGPTRYARFARRWLALVGVREPDKRLRQAPPEVAAAAVYFGLVPITRTAARADSAGHVRSR
jgi:hypothetical protein